MNTYIFPFDKVKCKEKVVVWGLGVVGREYIQQIKSINYVEIVAIVDSYSELKVYESINVVRPEDAGKYFDTSSYVVIAISKHEENNKIKKELLSYGVTESKIVDDIRVTKYDERSELDMVRSCQVSLIDENTRSNMRTIIGLPQFLEKPSQHESFIRLWKKFLNGNRENNILDVNRLIFIWKNGEEILKNVDGAIAELGVYKGDTAAVLAEIAAEFDRDLYLFDTFEGFNSNDKIGIDFNKNVDFSDTSLDFVKRNVGYDKHTHYYIGYFPDTIDYRCKEQTFSFVHIDCDLYKPIKQGLEFFYKRLNNKGMIVIHDYYSGKWDGATKAVNEFCDENNIEPKILVPDLSGSVVICKG